jgi:hypothetical protein
MTTRRKLTISAISIAALATLCVGAGVIDFGLTFEIFGDPTRNNDGWLGPLPRNATCVEDAGKVLIWTSDDISLFQRHAIGCRIWLWVNGLQPASTLSA